MSDTTTITPEERHSWRERLTSEFSCFNAELGNFTLRSLNALEHAEARAEKAETDNAALEEDIEDTEKNLKEFSGFIEELLSGLKHRFPVQYADLEGDEYCDDAFSSHDLFELVIDPAVNAAQKAEAERDRLRAERDWLAENCWKKSDCEYIPTREERGNVYCHECPHSYDCSLCWQTAARRAVAGEG